MIVAFATALLAAAEQSACDGNLTALDGGNILADLLLAGLNGARDGAINPSIAKAVKDPDPNTFAQNTPQHCTRTTFTPGAPHQLPPRPPTGHAPDPPRA